MSATRTRRACRPRALTLIELVVALSLVSVLAALAIPTFTAALGQGQDRQSASTIALVMTAARRVASLPGNHNTYPAVWLSAPCTMLPYSAGCTALSGLTTNPNGLITASSLSLTTGASTGPTSVSVYTFTTGSPATNAAAFAVLSTSGDCLIGIDDPSVPTGTAWGSAAAGSSAPACNAATLVGSSLGSITGTAVTPSTI